MPEFTACPGVHEEVYDIDLDESHTEPDFIKKSNDDTLLDVIGVMNEDVHVDLLHLDVYWNGNLFHAEEHKQDTSIEEQDIYELLFTVNIPLFAPSGAYLVNAIIKSNGSELGCVTAAFKL